MKDPMEKRKTDAKKYDFLKWLDTRRMRTYLGTSTAAWHSAVIKVKSRKRNEVLKWEELTGIWYEYMNNVDSGVEVWFEFREFWNVMAEEDHIWLWLEAEVK